VTTALQSDATVAEVPLERRRVWPRLLANVIAPALAVAGSPTSTTDDLSSS